MLPNFFIIGAAKAGTTSLHAYLSANPAISMSNVKEPNFFAAEDERLPFGRGRIGDRAAYEALFDGGAPLRGEASPSYSQHPRRPGVPERIQALVPEARFVYIVRDPVDRAVSHYQQDFYSSRERRSIEEAFRDLESENHPYAVASRYASQIEQYLPVFGLERFLIVDQAELAADTVATVRAVEAFLGAPPSETGPNGYARLNVASDKRQASPLLLRLRTSSRAQAIVARTSWAKPAADVLRRALSRSAAPPEPSERLRERLEHHLRPEAERLRTLTGRTFPHWSV